MRTSLLFDSIQVLQLSIQRRHYNWQNNNRQPKRIRQQESYDSNHSDSRKDQRRRRRYEKTWIHYSSEREPHIDKVNQSIEESWLRLLQQLYQKELERAHSIPTTSSRTARPSVSLRTDR